jgi:hypothetical protein
MRYEVFFDGTYRRPSPFELGANLCSTPGADIITSEYFIDTFNVPDKCHFRFHQRSFENACVDEPLEGSKTGTASMSAYQFLI